MSTMTKSTIGHHKPGTNITQDESNQGSIVTEKFHKMMSEGKTDGIIRSTNSADSDTNNIVVRNFLDQAAALEWVEFITSVPLAVNLLQGLVIADYVEDISTLTGT